MPESKPIGVATSDDQQQLVARVILGDLQRREKRLRQASGYFGCGASYLIITLALIGICIWRPEGWFVAAGILIVIGVALQVELRGVNRRIDALVEMQLKFEEEIKKPIKKPTHTAPGSASV